MSRWPLTSWPRRSVDCGGRRHESSWNNIQTSVNSSPSVYATSSVLLISVARTPSLGMPGYRRPADPWPVGGLLITTHDQGVSPVDRHHFDYSPWGFWRHAGQAEQQRQRELQSELTERQGFLFAERCFVSEIA